VQHTISHEHLHCNTKLQLTLFIYKLNVSNQDLSSYINRSYNVNNTAYQFHKWAESDQVCK